MKPRLDILSPEQKRLWPELSQVPGHFVLYGGTAIALRLGGRQSVDFDFFTNQPVSADVLIRIRFAVLVLKLAEKASETSQYSLNMAGALETVRPFGSQKLQSWDYSWTLV